MITLDITQVKIQKLITHEVGNKLRDEGIKLSKEYTIIEEDTLNYLLKYFLQPFNTDEIYKFSHAVDLELNEAFQIIGPLFEQDDFVSDSQNIAKLLYEYSMHPKIKGGELNVAYLENIIVGDEITNAIGIFKSENHSPFLKMKNFGTKYNINHELGIELKSMDKGCLVINSEKENGYKVLLASGLNRSADSQYWKDDFLKLKIIGDEYNYTKELMTLTKSYVTQQFNNDFEVTKAEQIEVLNRSMNYFKNHDSFIKEDFEQEVFQDSSIIESFRRFDEDYRTEKEIEIRDNFEISTQAVKKQQRVFKSVLKLDKNFDIYIHGDKNLIEKGIEKDGRKYYKIYYQEEK